MLCAKDMMKRQKEANILCLRMIKLSREETEYRGFTDTIQSHNEYKIIAMEDTQGQIERSLPKWKMVEEHEDIDVIMSLNDPTAMGALAALDSKDYKKRCTCIWG